MILKIGYFGAGVNRGLGLKSIKMQEGILVLINTLYPLLSNQNLTLKSLLFSMLLFIHRSAVYLYKLIAFSIDCPANNSLRLV